MKSLRLAAIALAVTLSFSSRGTLKGIGQDFQSLGNRIQRGAEWCTPE